MEQHYDFSEQTENESEKTWMLTPRRRSVGELLKDGWNSLNGHWGNAVLTSFIWMICYLVVWFIGFVSVLIMIVACLALRDTPELSSSDERLIDLFSYPISWTMWFFILYPLIYGLCNSFVKAKRDKTSVAVGDLFLAKRQYGNVVVVGFLFTIPYMLSVMAEFYEDVKGEYESYQ